MPHRMVQDFATPVLRNVDLGRGNWLLEFPAEGVAAAMRPAQFFMIGVPGSDVLLRRPFSVCGLPGTFADRPDGAVQILYRVYGRGTALLASLRAGATVQVLGPLGRGFTPPSRPDARIVLVAGGIGSAPFPAFLAELERSGRRATMIYGARTAGDLPLLDWFRERCDGVSVTTDDGTLGARGVVTDPLAEMLQDADGGRVHVYACGPSPMLAAVAKATLAKGVACDLSLEAPMACGFGVCLGCVVPTRREGGAIAYERVCVEGPVMRAERLAW
ncbi:MAG TPA: dihydroorotate dehydrogenase electron transfer subunit [Candidatus Polarisedimenticolaceae bacterium]|nr:dihydroorotate dehydrogenase electron transfer subunit [Candidatus Polarisedimenticolaceae bacterium]